MKRFLTVMVVTLVAMSTSAQWLQDPNVPAFHAGPPAKGQKLAPILSGAQLSGPHFQYAFQKRAYEAAAKIGNVLYQQPCYCYCDRGHGHKSLRSCFESEHGAACSACMKEVFYTYAMTKQKKTSAQIREGIMRGDWQKINLESEGSLN